MQPTKYGKYKGVLVDPNTTLYRLMNSKDKEDQKKASRLHDYCEKAYACKYELKIIRELRQQYADVL